MKEKAGFLCPYCGGEMVIDLWVSAIVDPAQQEAGPRSKRYLKSVEGLGVKGEGEQ